MHVDPSESDSTAARYPENRPDAEPAAERLPIISIMPYRAEKSKSFSFFFFENPPRGCRGKSLLRPKNAKRRLVIRTAILYNKKEKDKEAAL
ncbi:MAG: hypothetical protein IKH12_00400 [Clostridia bacterium]|nr:hypothetical protein [Clostridia bacterium]